MSENMASSTSLGSRPSRSTMRAYSAGVSPSSTARAACPGERLGVAGEDAASGTVLGTGLTRGQRQPRRDATSAFEQLETVGAAGQRVDRVLGVRHQPDNVARGVADPGDVVLRAVGVLAGRVA